MIIPNKLKKGDIIGVIAPSSPIEDSDIQELNNSIKLLEDFGFKVIFADNAYDCDWGYCESPKARAEDINKMFEDPEIKAIICATGGFNSSSTFEYLDYELIKNNPKILCGFSDSTSIENIISEKAGIITFNGPTLKSMTSWETDYAYRNFINRFVNCSLSLFENDDESYVIRPGVCEGELIGGNLSLVTKLVSGKYSVNFENKILFLEELYFESPAELVCENLFILKQNGVFDKINGIWLGNYEGEAPIEQILLDVLSDEYDFPIIKSNNFGHVDKKMIIPIGIKAKIDTNEEIKIRLLENCCK